METPDIFDQDRKESEYYALASDDEVITLPLTKLGFEALLDEVTRRYTLPLDDASRQVLAGYIHHIPNEQDSTTIETLGKVLHKAIANSTSWRIDQEVKEKRRAEAKRLQEEEAKKKEPEVGLSLVEQ